jgi:hypothetical protein
LRGPSAWSGDRHGEVAVPITAVALIFSEISARLIAGDDMRAVKSSGMVYYP